MKNTINQFMWGYQRHFQIVAERCAKLFLQHLDPQLFSNLFLVGFLQEDLDNRHKICLEPDDCGYQQSVFVNTTALADQLMKVDPKKSLIHGHPIAQKNHDLRLKWKSMREAVKKTLDGEHFPEGLESYVSFPVSRNGYCVFVVLQLDKAIVKKYPLLTITSGAHFTYPRSFLESAITAFFDVMSDELQKEHSGTGLGPSDIELEAAHKNAASAFTRSLAYKTNATLGAESLYEVCNMISSLRYEGESSLGKMVIAGQSHPNIKTKIHLKEPINLNDYVKVRKFLQLSNEDLEKWV